MKRSMIHLVFLLVIAGVLFCAGSRDSTIAHTPGMRIANTLQDKGIPPELVVLIISMLPIVELRGAIPVAHIMGINPFLAYFLSIIGNMIPVIPILLLIGPISRFLMRFKYGHNFFNWLFERTRRRAGSSIERYETLGLSVFVAIPLPITGAWTGSVAAFIFGIEFKHSFWAILLGVMVAGVIMTLLSLLGWMGAAVAGVVLIALLVKGLMTIIKGEGGVEQKKH